MYRSLILSPLLLLAAIGPAAAQTVTAEALRAHVEVLASDAFEGRKPGTAGEAATLAYISDAFASAGLEPAIEGKWLQPVPLAERKAGSVAITWRDARRTLRFDKDDFVAIGREADARVTDAPVWFVGHGVPLQIEGADLKGAVALVLYDEPELPGFPSYGERVRALTDAGAAAVVGIVGEDSSWDAIRGAFARGQNRIGDETVAPVQGAIPLSAATALLGQAGVDLGKLLNSGAGPTFRAVQFQVRATLDVKTAVNAYTSHNVVGRLRGTGKSQQTLLLLAHWDHLGLCRPEGVADRICNGAVDNASGIAMLIEAAKALATGPKPDRDILFLATTAEEMGLLGAQYYADHPVEPLSTIVAAFNADTVAITPKGTPVAILGRGTTALEPIIESVAQELGRTIDRDDEAAPLLARQDGWALTRRGVPALMVGGNFSDMKRLGRFLSGAYHGPDDEVGETLDLGGAAEDTDLLIALGRRIGSVDGYQPPAPR